jgi:hypothetical protein
MMNVTANPIKQAAPREAFTLTRRIGSTTYRANIYFNPEAKETMDDKIMRLLRNDLNLTPGHGTMGLSQIGRLSERGSL